MGMIDGGDGEESLGECGECDAQRYGRQRQCSC